MDIKDLGIPTNKKIGDSKSPILYVPIQPLPIPNACTMCPNHPSNGGSGICNCILGSQVTY